MNDRGMNPLLGWFYFMLSYNVGNHVLYDVSSICQTAHYYGPPTELKENHNSLLPVQVSDFVCISSQCHL